MKVIILAGGRGTRLGSKTDNIPKPMVQIGNKPVLWHIMKTFSYYGLNDFIICLGYKSQIIKDYFYHYKINNNDFTIDLKTDDIQYFNLSNEDHWKVSLIDTGLNALKGSRIKKIEKYLEADTNILTYGDGVANINIKKLVEFHESHGKTLTISGVHPPARFGEIVEKNNRVLSFEEKPQTSVGIINGGFMVFNKKLFDYLKEDDDCDLEVGPLQELTKAQETMVYKHSGSWECMDHERDILHLNNLWYRNKAFWKVWE